jgi:hypothetical protein
MLTHPTIDQLRTLKLDGMADAFIELQAQDTARDLAHAEWLALLLEVGWCSCLHSWEPVRPYKNTR